MKTNKFMLGLSILALSTSALLLGCGKEEGSDLTRVEQVVAEAEKMDRTQLFKKAAEELGSKTFNWYATSSRGGKVTKEFVAALNEAGGTSITENQIKYNTTVDGRIYTFLNAEIEAKNQVTSGALLQDGYQLQTKGIEKGYVNYVPKEWSEHAGVNKARDANPFTLQFQFKTWMYHKGMEIDNVWDFAKEGLVIDTMDPTNENVNMDWLIQLTSDDSCALLKSAFDDTTNSSGLTAADLAKYESYGGNRKYAFLFIERFIKNASFANDDGAALNNFMAADDHAAWIVYSKILKVEETEQISKKNIVIASLGANHSDGNHPTVSLKGFGGFIYKHYLMLTPESPLPWTACAFINFLSTTSTGYKGWKDDVGDYPSYGDDINANRKLGGHGSINEKGEFVQSDTGENIFPCLNDPSSNWWIDQAHAGVEDPAYIATCYNTVAAFAMQQIAAKKK